MNDYLILYYLVEIIDKTAPPIKLVAVNVAEKQPQHTKEMYKLLKPMHENERKINANRNKTSTIIKIVILSIYGICVQCKDNIYTECYYY